MRYTCSFLIMGMMMVLGLIPAAVAQTDVLKGAKPGRVATNDVSDFISINNILMWIGNNGMTAHNPLTDASGLEWPRGTGKHCAYINGLMWAGKLAGQVVAGGATWRYGLQAGPLDGNGIPANPADPKHRIYKVRKVDQLGYESALTVDERIRLREDFLRWPVQFGAPYTDKNKNGIYEPDFDDWLAAGDSSASDTPWFIGDEVLWFVSNDMDSTRTRALYGCAPVGLEVQVLLWGFNRTGPLGNMVFTKYTVINKGPVDYEDVYFANFSYPELGWDIENFVGVDTNAVLGFAYKAVQYDSEYGIPPALGFDFVQTPIVRASPTDQARFKQGLRRGYKNTPVSAFLFFPNGGADGVYKDPDLGTQSGSQQAYRIMQGFLYNGSRPVDPITGKECSIALAGDPLSGTGWIDGIVRGPGDRENMFSVGPCMLARNDTQEVVLATIVGRGSDRLSSLQVLKYYDRVAQCMYDWNFVPPGPPPNPAVLAMAQPGKIILHWGSPDTVNAIENFRDRGYEFQGYNVYQFPSAKASLKEAARLVTFDKVDNIATIFDDVIDERSGALVLLPVQFGTDKGIQHIIEITKDHLTGDSLQADQTYYFAVTAYSYTRDKNSTPRQVESEPVILALRPEPWDPGITPAAAVHERIYLNHSSGMATGIVEVEVIDPLRLTGDTYEVTFTSLGKVRVMYDTYDTLWLDNYASWDLTNLTRNNLRVIEGSRLFNGLVSDFYVVDGFALGVSGHGHYEPEKEILRRIWTGGPPVYTGDRGYILPEAGYLFFGSKIPGYDIVETVEIRFDRNSSSKGYLYLRGGTTNYAYQGYFPSPITVWDVTHKDSVRQLQWAFVEQSGSAAHDSVWAPTSSAGDREYLFILRDTYSDNPNPTYAGYKINSDAGKMPILYAAWVYQNQNYGEQFPWQDGDIWRIVPNVPFGKDDRYLFTTTAPTITPVPPIKDASKINVYPNPFLGATSDGSLGDMPFVTFTHLPRRAVFRIYTVSGMLVRSFTKDDAAQTLAWNLLNEHQELVAPGMYIVHISLPDLNDERILKLGVGVIYSIIKTSE